MQNVSQSLAEQVAGISNVARLPATKVRRQPELTAGFTSGYRVILSR
jgi:hypothetical protein